MRLSTHSLPIITGLALWCVGFGLWHHLTSAAESQLQISVQSRGEGLTEFISNELSLRLPAVSRMAHRWAARPGGTPEVEWRADARRYLRDSLAYKAIEWIDTSYHIRWVEPLKGNEKALGLDLGTEAWRRKPLELAR